MDLAKASLFSLSICFAFFGLTEKVSFGQKPLPAEKEGHEGTVYSAAFTKDQQRVVSGGADQTARIWNIADGRELAKYVGHQGPVLSVSVSPSGRLLATGAQDGSIRIWDIPQLNPIATYSAHQSEPRKIILSSDGTTLFSAAEDKQCIGWQTNDGKVAFQVASPDVGFTSLALRPDQFEIAVANANGSIGLYRSLDGKLLKRINGHNSPIQALFYSSNNSSPISIDENGIIRTWQVPPVEDKVLRETGGPLPISATTEDRQWTISAQQPGKKPNLLITNGVDGSPVGQFYELDAAVNGLSIAADKSRAITVGADKILRIWDITGNGFPQILELPITDERAITIFRTGNQQIFIGENNKLRLVNLADQKEVRSYEGADARIAQLFVTNDQIVSALENGKVLAWNIESGNQTAKTERPSQLTAAALSRDGTKLAIFTADKGGVVWDLPQNKIICEIQQLPAPGTKVQFDNEGNRIVFGYADSIAVQKLTEKAVLQSWEIPGDAPVDLSFASEPQYVLVATKNGQIRRFGISALQAGRIDGFLADAVQANGNNWLVVRSETHVRIYDLQTYSIVREFAATEEGAKLTSLAVRSDSGQLATGRDDGTVELWNPNSGESLGKIKFPTKVSSLAFSYDNQLLAAALGSKEIRVVQIATTEREEQLPLQLQQEPTSIQFSRDNKHLFVGTKAGGIEFWPIAMKKELRSLNGHNGAVNTLAFTPDGKYLVSGGNDRTVRVWDPIAGQQRFNLNSHQRAVFSVNVSKDSSLAVSTGGDSAVVMWDLIGGRQIKQVGLKSEEMYAVAIHEDRKRVAVGGVDLKLRMLDLLGGKEAYSVPAHKDFLQSLSFSPSYLRIVTCGYGGSIAIWNAENGTKLWESKLPSFASQISYDAEGKRLLAACGDGRCYVIDIPAEAQ